MDPCLLGGNLLDSTSGTHSQDSSLVLSSQQFLDNIVYAIHFSRWYSVVHYTILYYTILYYSIPRDQWISWPYVYYSPLLPKVEFWSEALDTVYCVSEPNSLYALS